MIQETPIADLGAFLAVVLPIVLAYISTTIYSGLRQLSEKIKTFGSTVHIIASTALSFAIGFVATKLGIAPDTITLGPLSPEVIMGVLTIIVSQGIYKQQKRAV